MKRVLGNRVVRKCVMIGCLAIEPCVHIIALATGTHVPHPEGIGSFAMQYLLADV